MYCQTSKVNPQPRVAELVGSEARGLNHALELVLGLLLQFVNLLGVL